jgi:hypothetical protein
MRSRSTIFFLILLTSAQHALSQKTIKGLINAEKQFAWFTSTHTVKEGFLQYMDSAGVIFQQGGERNALDFYKKQNAAPGILNWEPDFAVISASGDIGATSGPFTFRVKSAQDTPVGRGTFCSVWRINKQGEWKNLADLGSQCRIAPPEIIDVKEIILPKTGVTPGTTDELLLLDKKFNNALQEKKVGDWMPFISSDSRLNFDGSLPATGMLQIADALQKIPSGSQIVTKTGELSSAKDLGYTYGTIQNAGRMTNYLRVWIYRNKQWTAILQTIKW